MKKLITVFSLFSLIAFAGVSVHARTDNLVGQPCNFADLDDRRQIIHPALALCTVHAYNIGMHENPLATDTENRERMETAIRLKTTVMTQQLQRQYEFLDATVRRLETQLQRALLTARLEAAGAQTQAAQGAGGGAAANRAGGIPGGGIANAQNCAEIFSSQQQMQCLQDNASLIRGESNQGIAQRQLQNDWALLTRSVPGTVRETVGIDARLERQCANPSGPQQIRDCANLMGQAAYRHAREERLAETRSATRG